MENFLFHFGHNNAILAVVFAEMMVLRRNTEMKNKQLSLLILSLALILVLVLTVCLVSCQNKQKHAPKVGLCFRQCDASAEYCRQIRQTLDEAGYQVSVADAMNDQSRQTEQIQKFIQDGCALLVIEPVMVSTSEQLVDQVMDAQIPTVFVNYEPEAAALDRWERLSYVGCQENTRGTMQGSLILQTPNGGDLNGDGTVSCLVISGPEDERIARLQASGCVGALTDAQLTVTTVATLWGDWTLESGRKCCANALSQYGRDIEVIFCGNDAIALGAQAAISSGGWTVGKDYYLAGIGGTEQALQAIQTGNMTGTVVEDHQSQAQQLLTVAQTLLAGETAEKRYYVNCLPVTQENAENYLPK
jgi:methyl-galactoside transport system substrate-binding protein